MRIGNDKLIIFVGLSLLAFGCFIVLAFDFLPHTVPLDERERAGERFYFDKRATEGDPYLTVKPSLEKMLTGPIVTAADPFLGDREAPVVLVYFADPTCPYCARSESVVRAVAAQYGERVRLVWKDFPEPDPSSSSYRAAAAGRCAQAQNKFWEFHDAFLKSDRDLEAIDAAAASAGLDREAFAACRADETNPAVEENIIEAGALGIPGVPFLYVNQQEMFGEFDEKTLKRLIDVELDRD